MQASARAAGQSGTGKAVLLQLDGQRMDRVAEGTISYSPTVLPPEDRPIYHFTHISNLPNVLDQGYVNCDRIVREDRSLQVECGDQAIKERRRLRKVDPRPGGVVADYVPFYFAPRSPMLYKINKGSVPTYADGQDPLVYLVTAPRRLVEVGSVSAPGVVGEGDHYGRWGACCPGAV